MPRPTAALPPAPRAPSSPMPAGGIDAHVHLLGAPDEYPLSENRAEDLPEISLAQWLERYRAHLAALGAEGGVLVHSVLYGTDNRVTLDALAALGPGFAGVGLAGDDVSDAVLDDLQAAGIKALRLNLVHGGVLSWPGAQRLAPRLAERDMHLEMLLHAHVHLTDIAADIRALPVALVIDHIGWPDLTRGPDEAGFQTLLRLVGDGHAYVKLSAPYRMDEPPFSAIANHVSALAKANSERCLWGSDWPHLMRGTAAMPDAAALWEAFCHAVPEASTRRAIAVTNPRRLYGIG